jgi:glycine betaine/proline transport system ATP-binding protein
MSRSNATHGVQHAPPAGRAPAVVEAMTNKIEVQNVVKIFGSDPETALEMLRSGSSKAEILQETGQTVGVDDVSFEVREGEIFVVMGLSGSGKSTLVRVLNRLIPATSGSVWIDDDDVLGVSEEKLREIRLRKIAMVFQHFALFPHKSVRENVEYGLKIQGVGSSERRERAMTALEQVGLAEWSERRPQALSGGMQQRVGLARGLAVDPEILLMDEPFSALDPLIRRDMQTELLKLQDKLHKTIIFITHDLDEALNLGDRIAIMKEGRFVQVGTAEEIVANPADDYVAAFTKDIDRAKVFPVERVIDEAHPLEAGATAGDALARMDETGRDAVYVVEVGAPAGVVSYRDAASAEKDTPVSEIMHTDFATIHPEEHLNKVYGLSGAGLPIAVVGDDGKLSGVLLQARVLARLAASERREEDGGETAGDADSAAAA